MPTRLTRLTQALLSLHQATILSGCACVCALPCASEWGRYFLVYVSEWVYARGHDGMSARKETLRKGLDKERNAPWCYWLYRKLNKVTSCQLVRRSADTTLFTHQKLYSSLPHHLHCFLSSDSSINVLLYPLLCEGMMWSALFQALKSETSNIALQSMMQVSTPASQIIVTHWF